jgi:hypothetical protein
VVGVQPGRFLSGFSDDSYTTPTNLITPPAEAADDQSAGLSTITQAMTPRMVSQFSTRLLAELASSDSYSSRIRKISSGITVGSNTYTLNATTVQADGVAKTVGDGSARPKTTGSSSAVWTR